MVSAKSAEIQDLSLWSFIKNSEVEWVETFHLAFVMAHLMCAQLLALWELLRGWMYNLAGIYGESKKIKMIKPVM